MPGQAWLQGCAPADEFGTLSQEVSDTIHTRLENVFMPTPARCLMSFLQRVVLACFQFVAARTVLQRQRYVGGIYITK